MVRLGNERPESPHSEKMSSTSTTLPVYDVFPTPDSASQKVLSSTLTHSAVTEKSLWSLVLV